MVLESAAEEQARATGKKASTKAATAKLKKSHGRQSHAH